MQTAKLFERNVFERRGVFFAALIGLFVVSFAIPMLFVFKIGGIWSNGQNVEEEVQKDQFFPEASNISAPNSYLSIASSPLIEPTTTEDFLITVWIKLRKLPLAGERLLILAKQDPESASRRGYALALARESDSIRPEVYWRDDNNNGTWFRFADATIVSKAWMMFAISFREQKYLGLHMGTRLENLEPELTLLGGYELENFILPKSSSPLLLGAFNNGKFRGNLGAVGVFARPNLSKDLNDLLQTHLQEPKEITNYFKDEEVKVFLADGKNDASSNKLEVHFHKSKRGEKED